jgi:hypothetical protein
MAINDIAIKHNMICMQAFKGIWRLQCGLGGAETTLLQYAVFVRPMPWLPVALIQGRIEKEIKANLEAVRSYAEVVHTRGAGPIMHGISDDAIKAEREMQNVRGDEILVKVVGGKSSSSSSDSLQLGRSHPIGDDFMMDSDEEGEEEGMIGVGEVVLQGR